MAFWVLLGGVLLTFCPALQNGFVGDDFAVFVENNFYKNPAHLSRLVSPDFITKFSDIDAASQPGESSYSVCVAYRPVTAVSFFLSYFLWKENSLGHHFENIFLHFLVVWLVFGLLTRLSRDRTLGLLAALLYATHPINAEVVNIVSYRSDLLAVIFYLSAFLLYVRCDEFLGWRRHVNLGFSCFCFALGLFAKENVVTLPLVIMFYDHVLNPAKHEKSFKKKSFVYLIYFLILGFYLYVYLVVFPNANAREIFDVPFEPGQRLIASAGLLFQYWKMFLLPFTVTVLPPMYMPPAASLGIFALLVLFSLLTVAVVFVARYAQKCPLVSFGIFWALVAYLPTANLIPTPNPFSLRFLYLPMLGWSLLLVIFLDKVAVFLKQSAFMPRAKGLIFSLLLGINITNAFIVNTYYRSNLTACQEMVEKFPDSARPYMVLGVTYLNAGLFKEARMYFEKYLEVEPLNPAALSMHQRYYVHHMLGRCYLDLPERAIAHYQMALHLRPDYFMPYFDLAWIYLRQEKYQEALECSLKILKERKNLVAYAYIIESYVGLKQWAEAEKFFAEAMENFPGNRFIPVYKGKIKSGLENSQSGKAML